MTLVLFYANDEFAIVAADRRLTYPDKSIAENDRTKLLSCYQGLEFGFTGQVFLWHDRERKRVPAPMWLAYELAAQDGNPGLDFDAVARRLDIARLLPGDKRLAFKAIGFVGGTPVAVLVSNMHDANAAPLLRAERSFRAFVVTFQGERFDVLGGELSPKAKEMLIERIPAARQNPKAVAQLLAGAIERSTGPLIGKQSLVTTRIRNQEPGNDVVTCDTVTPGHQGPQPISDAAMPVFLGPGGMIMAVQHRQRDWPDP